MAATRLSFSYPEELKEELQKLASKDSRTLSSYIQKLLQDHITENTIKPKQLNTKKRKRKIKTKA